MPANVSPASYRFMIAGQSCWGIFPLLLDLSILRPSTEVLVVCLVLLLARGGDKAPNTVPTDDVAEQNELMRSKARATIAAEGLAEA